MCIGTMVLVACRNSSESDYVPAAPIACEVSELPWCTVSAVLKRVEEVRDYSYSQLVDWYQVGLVTVEVVAAGYEVRILDGDGLGDVLIINGF